MGAGVKPGTGTDQNTQVKPDDEHKPDTTKPGTGQQEGPTLIKITVEILQLNHLLNLILKLNQVLQLLLIKMTLTTKMLNIT